MASGSLFIGNDIDRSSSCGAKLGWLDAMPAELARSRGFGYREVAQHIPAGTFRRSNIGCGGNVSALGDRPARGGSDGLARRVGRVHTDLQSFAEAV